jgi:hypothetical protein
MTRGRVSHLRDLRSRSALEVAAVYTATDASGGVSVDVEESEGRRIRVKSNGNGNRLTICHFPPGVARRTLMSAWNHDSQKASTVWIIGTQPVMPAV